MSAIPVWTGCTTLCTGPRRASTIAQRHREFRDLNSIAEGKTGTRQATPFGQGEDEWVYQGMNFRKSTINTPHTTLCEFKEECGRERGRRVSCMAQGHVASCHRYRAVHSGNPAVRSPVTTSTVSSDRLKCRAVND